MVKNSLIFITLLVVWGLMILVLSLMTSPPAPQNGILGWDKFQHASAYGLFTLLCGLALRVTVRSVKRPWLVAFVAAVAYGGLIEILQGVFTRSRVAEPADLLADAIGAGLAAICSYCVVKANFWRRTR